MAFNCGAGITDVCHHVWIEFYSFVSIVLEKDLGQFHLLFPSPFQNKKKI
jgi:hypothetical protein